MQVRAATLNVWALPEPLGRLVPARMQAIGRELRSLDADVVAFQEVWTGAARRALLRAGRDAGFEHAWSENAGLGGSGLLVVARWPLSDARLERFSLPQMPSRPDHLDYYAGKGFVSLRLDTPEGPLRLVSTHLQARYGRHVRHEYRDVRIGQVIELAVALRHVREPALVLGDFNFRESHDEYRVFRGLTGLRDAAAEAGRREPTVDPSNPFRSPRRDAKRVDYVFLRDGERLGTRTRDVRLAFDGVFELEGGPASCSDHAGVLAEIEVHRSPAPVAGPQHDATRLAAALLAEGRERALREREEARIAASAGWAGALVAAAGVRSRRLHRRRFLRAGLQCAALAALTPGVGYALLSEVVTPDRLQAYDELADRLASVAPDRFIA